MIKCYLYYIFVMEIYSQLYKIQTLQNSQSTIVYSICKIGITVFIWKWQWLLMPYMYNNLSILQICQGTRVHSLKSCIWSCFCASGNLEVIDKAVPYCILVLFGIKLFCVSISSTLFFGNKCVFVNLTFLAIGIYDFHGYIFAHNF